MAMNIYIFLLLLSLREQIHASVIVVGLMASTFHRGQNQIIYSLLYITQTTFERAKVATIRKSNLYQASGYLFYQGINYDGIYPYGMGIA